MWFVAFFMIAAVFGNPEGWCNISDLKFFYYYYYYFTSFKKKVISSFLWFFFSADCILSPKLLLSVFNFLSS